MKIYLIIIFIALSGCKFESKPYEQKTYENVEEYCDDYSSHLVDGPKRDGIRNGCLDTYRDDF